MIAEHKAWVADKDLCGRIYFSTQGINAQYSGLAGQAEGYAEWMEQQELFRVRTVILKSIAPCSSSQHQDCQLSASQLYIYVASLGSTIEQTHALCKMKAVVLVACWYNS